MKVEILKRRRRNPRGTARVIIVFHRTSIGEFIESRLSRRLETVFSSFSLSLSLLLALPFSSEIDFSTAYSRQLKHKGKIRGSEGVVDAKWILFRVSRIARCFKLAPLQYSNARFSWLDASRDIYTFVSRASLLIFPIQ